MPPLWEENFDAVAIYRACQNQVIVAPMGGVVGINHLAVHEAMRLFEVNDPQDCFRKVLKVAEHVSQLNKKE